MASFNLDNDQPRDRTNSSQGLPQYFEHPQFNLIDPALSQYDGTIDTLYDVHRSNSQPSHLIGQDLAPLEARNQLVQQASPPSEFGNEWNRHILANEHNNDQSRFFNIPYDQNLAFSEHDASHYGPEQQLEAANRNTRQESIQQYEAYSSQSKPGFQSGVAPFDRNASNLKFVSGQDATRVNQSTPSSPWPATAPSATSNHVHAPLPPGNKSGNFIITSIDDLDGRYRSQRLHNFVNIGIDTYETAITKTALPAYVPRKSRNEIIQLLQSDPSLKSKVNKKLKQTIGGSLKKTQSRSTSTTSSKAASSSSKRTSSDNESAEDDSSSTESEDGSTLPPLPAQRPSDPSEAVSYDAIKALWRIPQRSVTRDDIQKGLADFWKVIGPIRNRWRSDAAAIQEAETAKNLNDLPLLKEKVANQRRMLDAALRAALQHGHEDLLGHLGRHSPLMAALAAALHDRARETDYDGLLTKSILGVLSKCASMIEDETLTKTTMVKIVQRFAKRGDDTVKNLAGKILSDITAASQKKPTSKLAPSTQLQSKDRKEGVSKQSKADPAKAVKKAESTDGKLGNIKKDPQTSSIARAPAVASVGTKRLRDNDSQPGLVSKKLAVSSKLDQTTSAKNSGASAELKQQSSPPGVKKVVPKLPNFLSSLQPTYKSKPTTNTTATTSIGPASTAKESVAKVDKNDKGPVPKPDPQLAPSFSFSSTMATLKKPKEVEPEPEKVETTPVETAEEKAIRLRKEKRRSLRVSFKPENELTEIRYFEHDPDEEMGHNASEMRDAGDLEQEGRMFKLKQQQKQDPDKMELDDEEDDDEEEEEHVVEREFEQPTEIDFSDMPKEVRDLNYVPYGGGFLQPDSPEAANQRQRETETLVVVYSRSSDVPPNPKEPPESIEEEQKEQEHKEFGKPSTVDHEWFTNRLRTMQTKDQSPKPSIPVDLSAIFGSLAQPAKNTQASQPQQVPSASDLEEILKHLQKSTSQNVQSTAQPQQPYQQQQLPMPSFQGQQYPQTQPPSAYTPNLQATPFAQQPLVNSQPSSSSDISSLLASITRQYPTPGQVGYVAASNGPEVNPPQFQNNPYANEGHGRASEGQTGNSGGGNYMQQQQQQRPWQNKKPRDPNRPTPKFIYPCRYFQLGKCTKGADCTYRHDVE